MTLHLRTILLLIMLTFAAIQTTRAQKKDADSILRQIRSAREDTSRVKAYFDYALIQEDINLDSAAKYYQLGGDLSKKINYYEGLAHFAKNYSVVLNMQGKFDESMAVNRSLLDLATAKGNQQDIAKTLNNIASVFNHRGQYDSAYQYYLQSARLFEQLKEDRYLNIIYQNIAIILDNLQQHEKALEYHRMSIEKSRAQKDTAGIASVMLNAAGTLNTLHRYDSSLILSEQALALSRQINNLYYQHVALLTIGNIHAQKKNFVKAFDHFQRSLKIARKLNYNSGLSVSLNGLAMTSMKMGRLKEADKYATQALAVSDESIPFSETIQRLKLIAEIKSGLKQYDSAYHYILKYTTLQDSLAGITTAKHVAGLEMKYQSALKDKSIAEQLLQIRETEDKIRKRNNWLWVVLGVLSLVTAISVSSYISYRSKKKLLSQQILTLQKEKELESIKVAMEAREHERQRIGREMHDDLGAGLTSILYLVNSLKSAGDNHSHLTQIEKISETATGLISQMRDIVWAMNNEYDTVDDLVAYIRHQAGTLLSQADIEYEINTPENIPYMVIRGEQRRNIYLVTKEAVHNIIKHACASFVELKVEVDGQLKVTIRDNGKGIDEIKSNWGNGIKNMKARMENAGGSFSVSPANPGTLVELSLNPVPDKSYIAPQK